MPNPKISKVKLSDNQVYDVKHSNILSAMPASPAQDGDDLLNAYGIRAYVDSQMEVAFELIVINEPFDIEKYPANNTNYERYHNNIVLFEKDDQSETRNIYEEYVITRSSTAESYSYAWEKIGDTAISLVGIKSHGPLSGSVTLTDYMTGASVSNVSTVDSAAPAHTSTNVSLTRGDYTPSGNVTLNEVVSGGVQVKGTNAASEVTFTTTEDTFVKSLKAGTVNAASFTEGAFTPASISSGFFDPGTLPSYSHTGFSGGSFNKGTAITVPTSAAEGVVASYQANDEMLVFSAASMNSATTGIMPYSASFTAASYGTDTWDPGTLPSIDLAKFSGGSKAADTFSAQKLPVVDATASAITSLANVEAAAQTFTGGRIDASFSGTKETNLKVTGATYDKTTSINLTKTDKTIAITPTTTTKTAPVNLSNSGNFMVEVVSYE